MKDQNRLKESNKLHSKLVKLGKVTKLTKGAGRQYVDGRKDSERQ